MMDYFLFINMLVIVAIICTVSAQSLNQSIRPESILGSIESSQAAIKSFEFILAAPRNCLETIADLPNAPSKNMAALWIRAAFHDAGTFPVAGADASLMHHLKDPVNAGLEESIAPKFQQNRNVNMSNADSIALAAQVSVTHCGGPKFPFKAGRVDTTKPTSPKGLIPNGLMTLDQFRPRFAEMGWTNEDIVALVTGSHTMGGIHGKISPELTDKEFIPFDDTAGIFDNHVFKFSLEGKCLLKIDCEIAADPILRPIVKRYAEDQNAFFEQYKISFQKLIQQTKSVLGNEQDLVFSTHVGLKDTEQPPVNFPSKASRQGSLICAILVLFGWVSI